MRCRPRLVGGEIVGFHVDHHHISGGGRLDPTASLVAPAAAGVLVGLFALTMAVTDFDTTASETAGETTRPRSHDEVAWR
jgi:hypothetical protein